MVLLERDGSTYDGAEAVYRALLHAVEPPTRWRARLGLLPGVLGVSQGVYRLVARRRRSSARLDRLLFGRETTIPTYHGVSRLYLRGLGGIFAIAFHSLSRQLPGLWGARGIAPARDTLEWQGTRLPTLTSRLTRSPSVFWFTGVSDQTLLRAASVGRLAGVALCLGVLPMPALLCATALYLSFLGIGREFLTFQWDALLVESGMHALLLAPWGLSLRSTREPTPVARLAHRLLFLRLTFGSGLGKWQSGDERWRDGSALATHHETTPLPTTLGWYAHQLPLSTQRLFTRGALAIELGAPFLAFGPRSIRSAGFALCNALQFGIAATGNYGFFNLLSLLLSLWSLDDAGIGPLAGRHSPPRARGNARELFASAAAIPFVAVSLHEQLARFRRSPRPLRELSRRVRPLMLGNSYALFSVMTGTRPELVVEGSRDGVHWERYGFPFKVQDPARPPPWAAPHMPRLDWQLWFAALGSPHGWFLEFAQRLLEGSPEVRRLLARDPFPDAPPRYLRAILFRYRMTHRDERAATGDWWARERLGLYLPPIELGPSGLRRARDATVIEGV